MFKNVSDVQDATNSQIVEIVSKTWNAGLDDILTQEDLKTLKEAREIKTKAEDIAFAIRSRFNAIEEEGEAYDNDEDDIDEFMNSIASALDQNYNGEYEYRPDYFWTPSTC